MASPSRPRRIRLRSCSVLGAYCFKPAKRETTLGSLVDHGDVQIVTRLEGSADLPTGLNEKISEQVRRDSEEVEPERDEPPVANPDATLLPVPSNVLCVSGSPLFCAAPARSDDAGMAFRVPSSAT